MKFEKLVFKILLFFLPVQLGYHFWPQWSLVWGIRVDYLAPTVYLTDLLIGTLFVLWLQRKCFREIKINKKRGVIFLFSLSLISFNIYVSQVWQVSLLGWLKVFEVSFLGYWLFSNFKVVKESLSKIFSGVLLYTTLIALGQILFQRSLGGILYFLGERSFNLNTPGIALFSLGGESLLRPYSIFSHPNSFAGFLLLSLGIVLALGGSKKMTPVEKLGIGAGVVGVIVSFSQAAWFSLGVMLALSFIIKKVKKIDWRFVYLITLGGALYFAFTSCFLGSIFLASGYSFPQTIERRLELSTLAGFLFSQKILLGVGMGNFVSVLPGLYQEVFLGSGRMVSWWLQPVHNIFLLTLCQAGVGGFGFLVWLFGKVSQKVKTNPLFLLPLLVILVTGSLDHYWLTLQQNFLLFGVFFAIILAWEK